MVYSLVLLRHGESVMNKENRFCGWIDVDLSDNGKQQARDAAEMIRKHNLTFGHVFTSILKRSYDTASIVLEELNQKDVPSTKTWRLNERHYGALQGLDKIQVAQQYGEAQVKQWRRSYDIPPPKADEDSPHNPKNNHLFDVVPRELLPNGESLKLTLERVMPFWKETIVPELKKGRPVFIAAHGNSLRGLIKMLDNMSEAQILEFDLPTGVPVLYKLNEDFTVNSKEFLIDEAALKAKMEAEKNAIKKQAAK
ncbi:phosphoglycerate mutase [Theileria orientalis]|uniref:Phosphoglycerate mutase n=1 Tax=Theileria orientalis TaxID=68886 RepID=A0A976M7F4_THEOR|nr:phosphoglycerate mutase [Theileria orientalis]